MSRDEENIDIAEEELTNDEAETATYILRDKHCDVCGKVFCRLSYVNYAYKIPHANGYKFFCSWGCMQKYRRLQEEKRDKSKDEKRRGVATDKEARVRPPKYSTTYKRKRRKL